MIRLIPGSLSHRYPEDIDAMFRSRAETFYERLGWDVVVESGYEKDRFDEFDPLYLVSVDPDSGEYWGSLRLLKTTGPNMLRDVFPQLLGGHEPICDPGTWESSRISVAIRDNTSERTKAWLNYALCELLLGVGEVAVAAGLTRIVSVFDARMLRILRTAGCEPRIIGTPQRVGKAMSYAGLFDASFLMKLQENLGISSSVLAPETLEHVTSPSERSAGVYVA